MSVAEQLNDASKVKQAVRLFTYWVEDALFGLPIENVISVSQDMSGMRVLPGDGHIPGALGMIEFLNHVVPVVDFAESIGLKSGASVSAELIELLKAREQDHTNWLNALEKSLKEDIPFNLARNPHECAFGKWYDKFTTNDESLADLMEGFDAPHKRIHAMADHLMGLNGKGKKDEAFAILKREREITMARLLKRFSMAREHLDSVARPVLLYVTSDGQTPIIALKIDQIHDVIEYDIKQQLPVNSLSRFLRAETRQIVSAYLSDGDDGNNCIQISPVAMAEL